MSRKDAGPHASLLAEIDLSSIDWMRKQGLMPASSTTVGTDVPAHVAAILDAIPVGMVLADCSGIVRHINSVATELLASSDNSQSGHTLESLFGKEHVEKMERELLVPHSTSSTQQSEPFIAFKKKISGVNSSLLIHASRYILNDTPYALLSIHDRSEHEIQLDSLTQYSRALDQIADSIIITDTNGIIEYVNRGFTKITGYSKEEVLGERPGMLKSGVHDHQFYKNMWSQLNKGRVFQHEVINRRKDGAIYYEEKTITPIRDRDGNVTHYISSGKDITERIENKERLRHLAYHDHLTDLPNRLYLNDQLNDKLSHYKRNGSLFALLFLDLDSFKTINDTMGHSAGDEILRQFSTRLRDTVREIDIVARFSGDEFAIVLDDISIPDDAATVAKSINRELQKPFSINELELYITSSIGIAIAGSDGNSSEEMLKSADIAMYKAKERGPGHFAFYSPEIDNNSEEKLKLIADLRKAVDREQLQLHFQPQVCTRTKKLLGVEALLRWEHPVHGNIPPVEFIPLLEDTDLIHEAGRLVIKLACQHKHEWKTNGVNIPSIAINISPKQFVGENLVSDVTSMTSAYGLDPSEVELEITESSIMENTEHALRILNQLSDIGHKISLDDFGTGYSSLGQLRTFPIAKLKIDKVFVNNICNDIVDGKLMRSIIAMANSLSIDVIAEGVETDDQYDFLLMSGCRSIQGYYFSRPLNKIDIIDYATSCHGITS